jgi:hypothetical protein
MKAIVALMIFLISTSPYASVISRPSKSDSYLALLNYSYIHEPKVVGVRIFIEGDASKFVSEASIFRYLKLKFRNFIQDYSVIELTSSDVPENRNLMYITIEQHKYNDTREIYYGLTAMEVFPRFADSQHRPYQLIFPEAGSDTQIENSIKGSIDKMIEVFASDYYLIEDFKKEKVKTDMKKPKIKSDEEYFK